MYIKKKQSMNKEFCLAMMITICQISLLTIMQEEILSRNVC